MFAIHLRKTPFPIKQIVTGSVVLRKIEPFSGFVLFRNQIIERFYSSVNLSSEKKLFTISYLVNACGLSQETAVSASEKVCFGNSSKPDSILNLLKREGLSKKQISDVVRKKPEILVAKECVIFPKFEFLRSVGVPKSVIAFVVSRDPTYLRRSLKNQTIPNYVILKSILATDERVVKVIKKTIVLQSYFVKNLRPNVKTLSELKVSESNIKLLLTHYPEAILQKPDAFRATVDQVSTMGFSPLKSSFVLALHALSGKSNNKTWAMCYETYSSWGCSRDDIYMAFKKFPSCMLMSCEKISRTMDFLVNKMGLNAKLIARYPAVLCYNLENRTIPRCSVMLLLLSRGLIRRELSLTTFLYPREPIFLERFVFRYEKEAPDLLDFYKRKEFD